jgi:sporulation protein YtfJ
MSNIIEQPEHPIERLMSDSMSRMKALVDTDTVIGTPVALADGSTVIPVSRVTLGFMTGGGEYSDQSCNKKGKEGFPFAGGSGGGLSVTPIGFLISDGKSLKMMPLDGENAYDKLLSLIPDLLSGTLKGLKS